MLTIALLTHYRMLNTYFILIGTYWGIQTGISTRSVCMCKYEYWNLPTHMKRMSLMEPPAALEAAIMPASVTHPVPVQYSFICKYTSVHVTIHVR